MELAENDKMKKKIKTKRTHWTSGLDHGTHHQFMHYKVPEKHGQQ